MQYQQLGKTNLKVSSIAFGCMSLNPDLPEHESLLLQALDKGINFFDTADLYNKGANEAMLGRIFKNRRKEVVIASKAGNQWRPDGSGWDWNPRKEYILQCAEQSLRRLQTDYIDLFQLHGGTINDPIDETIEAFELLVEQGKILYYGISSIRHNVIREWVKRSNIKTVMMQYSLLDRRPEEFALDFLHEHKIAVLARGSMAQGLLAGKPATPYLGLSEIEVKDAAAVVTDVSAGKRTPAQTAMLYVLHHPAVQAAVPGISKAHQLGDALEIKNLPPLTPDEIIRLQQSVRPEVYEDHR